MWWLRARSSRAGSTRVGTPRMTSWPGTSQWRWRWRRGAQRLRRGGEGDSCAGPSAQEAPPRIAHRRGLAIHPPTRIDRPWDHPAVDSRSTSLRFVSLIDSTTSPADHFISEIRWIAETLGQHSENAQLCVVIGSTCVDRHRRLTPKSVHPRLASGAMCTQLVSRAIPNSDPILRLRLAQFDPFTNGNNPRENVHAANRQRPTLLKNSDTRLRRRISHIRRRDT